VASALRTDFVVTGGGVNTASGGPGNDNMVGGGGDDRMKGNQGSDVILGGEGSDYLESGPEANVGDRDYLNGQGSSSHATGSPPTQAARSRTDTSARHGY
jgi:Ca2+-binding RTX toxin-like protein